MNTAIAGLLQMTAAFLLGVQKNPNASLAAQKQAVAMGSQVVQIATQQLADINFPVPQDSSKWPTITDLQNAPYLNATGGWVPLGQGVTLVSTSTSFGDLNADGLDDAVALVMQTRADGSSEFSFAAFLNQGGILFNIADAPLGADVQVYTHSIQNGEFVVDMQEEGQARAVRRYALVGNAFGEVNE